MPVTRRATARPDRRLEQPADRRRADDQDDARRELPVELRSRGGKVQAWKTVALTGRATKAATTIEFQNGDPGSDNDSGLDAVGLVKR
jgi:hypothetical protein